MTTRAITDQTASVRAAVLTDPATSNAASLPPTATMAETAETAQLDGPPGWTPGPLQIEPRSVFPPYTEQRDRWGFDTRTDRAAALAHALAGVPLGAYDTRILTWLAGWDNPTVATVVSLIRRARIAAAAPPPPHPTNRTIPLATGKEHP